MNSQNLNNLMNFFIKELRKGCDDISDKKHYIFNTSLFSVYLGKYFINAITLYRILNILFGEKMNIFICVLIELASICHLIVTKHIS